MMSGASKKRRRSEEPKPISRFTMTRTRGSDMFEKKESRASDEKVKGAGDMIEGEFEGFGEDGDVVEGAMELDKRNERDSGAETMVEAELGEVVMGGMGLDEGNEKSMVPGNIIAEISEDVIEIPEAIAKSFSSDHGSQRTRIAPVKTEKAFEKDVMEALCLGLEEEKTKDADQYSKRCPESGCGKEFNRAGDFTRHKNLHPRPWKCPIESCRYHEYGWAYKSEMERHYEYTHSSAPKMYECHYQPCQYRSTSETNCKRHMERMHGWTYVRSKNYGKNKDEGSSSSVTGTEDSSKEDNKKVSKAMNPITPIKATPSIKPATQWHSEVIDLISSSDEEDYEQPPAKKPRLEKEDEEDLHSLVTKKPFPSKPKPNEDDEVDLHPLVTKKPLPSKRKAHTREEHLKEPVAKKPIVEKRKPIRISNAVTATEQSKNNYLAKPDHLKRLREQYEKTLLTRGLPVKPSPSFRRSDYDGEQLNSDEIRISPSPNPSPTLRIQNRREASKQPDDLRYERFNLYPDPTSEFPDQSESPRKKQTKSERAQRKKMSKAKRDTIKQAQTDKVNQEHASSTIETLVDELFSSNQTSSPIPIETGQHELWDSTSESNDRSLVLAGDSGTPRTSAPETLANEQISSSPSHALASRSLPITHSPCRSVRYTRHYSLNEAELDAPPMLFAPNNSPVDPAFLDSLLAESMGEKASDASLDDNTSRLATDLPSTPNIPESSILEVRETQTRVRPLSVQEQGTVNDEAATPDSSRKVQTRIDQWKKDWAVKRSSPDSTPVKQNTDFKVRKQKQKAKEPIVMARRSESSRSVVARDFSPDPVENPEDQIEHPRRSKRLEVQIRSSNSAEASFSVARRHVCNTIANLGQSGNEEMGGILSLSKPVVTDEHSPSVLIHSSSSSSPAAEEPDPS